MAETPGIDEIVRGSGSNLALALLSLPKERRRDMQILYAFCRVVDDIADDPQLPAEQKQERLAKWELILEEGSGSDSIESAVLAMAARRGIPKEELQEIVRGVAMDIDTHRYKSWDELRRYCHRVASCVGFASIRIFGCTEPASRHYAEHLGYALQLTNILRDVAQDWDQGRLYLPRNDLERFGVAEADFAARRLDDRMRALLEYEAQRALEHFNAAQGFLTEPDRPRLFAAETMREIYARVLSKMQRDGYRVFEKRYRLTKPAKIALVAGAWLRARLARRRQK